MIRAGPRPLALVAVTAAAACGPKQQTVPLCAPAPAVEAELAAILQAHVDGHLASDPVAAAALYAPDVRLVLDGGVEVRTRASMETVYAQLYATTPIVALEYTDEEVTVCGDAAHVVGHYVQTVDADGERVTTRARYMVLWRRQSYGAWKLARGAVVGLP